jgi:hypothetical protein
MVSTRKRPKRFSLYWCTTDDGDEDWFVVAASARDARRFHEDAEGYDHGDASAERIAPLPRELLVERGWKDGPRGAIHANADWPSDELLAACGGEVAERRRDALRDAMAVVCKDVRFGGRVFRAGDVVANMERVRGQKRAVLSIFKGGKGA